MMTITAELFVKDSALKRHWCPSSEKYAGGDALLTAFEHGWQLNGVIFCQEHWHGGARRVRVYHVDLVRGLDKMRMRVLVNPFVERLSQDRHWRVVLMNQRKGTVLERW